MDSWIRSWILGFGSGFLDSAWILGFGRGFLDSDLDSWIRTWILVFGLRFLDSCGFPGRVYEIPGVSDPSVTALAMVLLCLQAKHVRYYKSKHYKPSQSPRHSN